MPQSAKKSKNVELDVAELRSEEVTFHLLGVSPLVMHQMSLKVRQELLIPAIKTRVRHGLKHDPMAEYRASVYRRMDQEAGPTRLLFPASAFKRAMGTAALDIPAIAKTQIGRLTWVIGDYVDVFGVPELLMDVVRSSDVNRTPDVHTWAILPRWATQVTVRYVTPILSNVAVFRLMAPAGLTVGIGDGRQEKGHKSRGQWEVVNADDPRYLAVMEEGGMAAQDRALAEPDFYDAASEELFGLYQDVLATRGLSTSNGHDDEEEGVLVGADEITAPIN